jgi:hypothetical protein
MQEIRYLDTTTDRSTAHELSRQSGLAILHIDEIRHFSLDQKMPILQLGNICSGTYKGE